MIMTHNLPISLLLFRTITMKMLLHHIYFLHPKYSFEINIPSHTPIIN
jgi:hypothetical protein